MPSSGFTMSSHMLHVKLAVLEAYPAFHNAMSQSINPQKKHVSYEALLRL